MDPTAIIGSVLFRIGSHLFAPKPPAAPVASGTTQASGFAKSLSMEIAKSQETANVHPLDHATSWPDVQNALRLLESRGPMSLSFDGTGCLVIQCQDGTEHFVPLGPDRLAELRESGAFSDGASPLILRSQHDFIGGVQQVLRMSPHA